MLESECLLIDEMLSHLKANFIDYESSSQVAKFYANRSIFITGATGFIGKALVEKLLRSCKDIGRIYLLIREKKGKDAKDRLSELKESQIFGRIRSLPESREALDTKLCAISGDITLEGFGVSEKDMEELSREVSIVFNSAATVRFSEPIDVAVRNNIYSVRQLMSFCDKLSNLQALVHLSTAYSNCNKSDTIQEIFYEPPMKGEQIMRAISTLKDLQAGIHENSSLKEKQQKFYPAKDSSTGLAVAAAAADSNLLDDFTGIALRRSNRPNTYTFTKAISEYYLLELAKEKSSRYLSPNGSIPVGIVRPSIVTGAWREPEVGFVDNYNGPTGAILSLYTGALQAMPGRGELVADLVPVDMVTNMLISTGWFLTSKLDDKKKKEEEEEEQQQQLNTDQGVYLFNFVSCNQNPLCWGKVTELIADLSHRYPSKFLARLPSSFFIQAGPLYSLYDQLNHKLPAKLMDLAHQAVTGKKVDKRNSAIATYTRCRQLTDTLTPFTSNQWHLDDTNVRALYKLLSDEDKRIFPFDVKEINWNDYIRNYIVGARIYTLRDEPKNIPAALGSLKKRKAISRASLSMFILLFCYFICRLFFL